MRELFTELWRGKDVYRILMNTECRRFFLRGLTVDVGSGKNLASYHRFFQCTSETEIKCLDLALGNIDLETDALPYTDNSIDTILVMNLLEHIYNFKQVISESHRTIKSDGQVIGVVPFLVAYHPDPHDYWRYSEETLKNIFTAAGFSSIEIKPFGRGVGIAAYSQIEIILPKIIKMILLPLVFGFDAGVGRLCKRSSVRHYPLGYFFVAKK
ncbi:MAG: hypothetical protein A2821_02995 [Candidatus Magasanikbacteria bacterium RIFCSPHIGHO2_01_FULL_41_23]|uniref:Methyltransferase type 11 domain-containing protein n=1 Tax=Candidatus Magasanikbacteria bacterium RIFCSPLOWO2_01_FULL_40_15 TaxID=1798686 RepID=A0A1F6N3M8_9BACT|nr:MAG: hypothetical protein A2821_02995 [Candidatus Magasanikbacteria bacterium RIFCSPHIGHO2_01_FULL_41_23]OGH67305.1 MAG: hypothetical protein A3C66_01010 [Candidatus Magasanikbacteria bacterium RIFCSPHIGHO2_02_FULL_41_35]OGH76530.1 MAG: hypothetical protein A3F22_00220 [Candidatus Magasanikbacteria bacterium RIFCSPHIGHO2_12_FULL_41_16]OGH78484.1 MAG: hypothetical protein A2983_03135 [Candidatus Magasanikbacteria bacterium RIFCSPLOWO2_01_FULL_40_15]